MQAEAGRLPRPHNEEDALKTVDLAEKINEAAKDKAEIDADIIKKVSYTAAGELSPMAATLGGIVGQEVRVPPLFTRSRLWNCRLLGEPVSLHLSASCWHVGMYCCGCMLSLHSCSRRPEPAVHVYHTHGCTDCCVVITC